jgi:hypothetical protein
MTLGSRQAGLAATWWVVGVLAVAALLGGLYIWIMLSWSYSDGERAGWVQKLSRKGFICKTWEGEMAMVTMPGAIPEKFIFTVWDQQTAGAINKAMGKRVALMYEEHIGLPSSCFGETRYFVKAVKVIEDAPPLMVPSAGGTGPRSLPSQPQPAPAQEPAMPTRPEAPNAPARQP